MILAEVVFYDIGLVGEGFHYKIPEVLLSEYDIDSLMGELVRVDFGKIQKKGIIIDIVDKEIEDKNNYLTIINLEKNPFGKLLNNTGCKLIKWIADYYKSPIFRVLKLFVPEKIWSGSYLPKEYFFYKLSEGLPEISTRSRMLLLLVDFLKNNKNVNSEELKKHFSTSLIKNALDKNIIQKQIIGLEPVMKNVIRDKNPLKKLTIEQQEVFDKICEKGKNKHLIFGITGAGKTEIYLYLAWQNAQKGKQTLLLVPEISLTPQLLIYFQKAFGDRISLFHSRLSMGEKHQEWLRVRNGDSDFILGSRSALFAPFKDLGAIIIDEEHEWTYKNERNPKYNAKTVSEVYIENIQKTFPKAKLIFGSATPSIETMYKALENIDGWELQVINKKVYEQKQGERKQIVSWSVG